MNWEIGAEIVEEVEEFKYLGVWVDRKLQGNVQFEKMAEEWIGRVAWMSTVNGQVEVDRGRMVWKLLARPSKEYAEMWWTEGRSAYWKFESNGQEIVGGKKYSSRSGRAGRSRVEKAGGTGTR